MSSEQRTATGGREGILFVISAPSGAGKTSLCKQIVDICPGLRHSVSYTTRPRRVGEADGVDYHFVDCKTFDAMVADGAFAEWAEVHGNRYGTALETLQRFKASGHDLLLDIDCQGAAQLKRSWRQGVFIFVLPPSFDELRRRLATRNTDSTDVIARRLDNARHEIPEAAWYDYIVVNDDFDRALEALKAIIVAEGSRASRLAGIVERILSTD